MNTFQRIIKYAAIAFAVFLTIAILTGIVGALTGVLSIFNGKEESRIDYSKEFSGIEQLDINHKLGKLNVKTGSGFKVEATNVSDRFRAEVVNGTLVIDEPDFARWFKWLNKGRTRMKSIVTVYVPEDFNAKRIKIDSGAGEIKLEDLSAQRLIINAGVGDVYGKGIKAMRVDADGGVGNISLVDVDLTDVDFDCGVGNINIEGQILGKSEFDCGVGSVNIKIKGAREDYALKVSAGLGRVRVNDQKVSGEYNDSYRADNTIKIDGGVGDVDITFSH